MSHKRAIIILLILGGVVHFAFFGHPNQTVFDEVHFGKFVSGYYTGEYYFDIHPPLGKLMIAGFAKIFDFKPEFSFVKIGDQFPDSKYMALRFLPSLAGALLPVVIFLLAIQLKFTPRAAFAGGFLIAMENALLVQTRYILMDGFLLLFGFLALLFYFRRKFLLMAIFGAFAASIKWTGLTFLVLPFFVESFQLWKQKNIKQSLKLPLYFLAIPLVIYFSVFVVHFSLLTKPGSGDAFMRPTFHQDNIFSKFAQLNMEMYRSNQRLTATHPYSSQWFSWPFMAKPIFYWVNDNPSTSSGQAARIYFFGNPAIWWASTVAVLYGLWTMANGLWLKFKEQGLSSTVSNPLAILLTGYWLNLLPFIGIKRVMFLYHYLAALIFAVLMLCYLIDGSDKLTTSKTKNSQKIFMGIAIAAIVLFVFFAPLSYGLPLSDKAYGARLWLPSWK